MTESYDTKPQPTITDRIKAAKTAFISAPESRRTPETIAAIQNCFPSVELSHFQQEDRERWQADLTAYLARFDMIIVLTDESREITGGQLHETLTAKRAGLLVAVFNAATSRWERFGTYIRYREDGNQIRHGSREKAAKIKLDVWKPPTQRPKNARAA